jgi:hypothetical protein
MPFRAKSLVVVLVTLAACTGSGKREAAALTEVVDRFRATSGGASGAAQADAVRATPCSDDRVCDAKRTCVAAVDPTAKALALKNEVAQKLADIEAARLAPDAPEAQALPQKLDDASRLLREGHDKMEQCDTKLTDLRLAYGF